MAELEVLTFETDEQVDSCVIWLHGLGADGFDFYNALPMLGLAPELKIRFIFPHAPVIPVTINAGHRMRSWFDIYGIGENAAEDELGIIEAANSIDTIISQQLSCGISASRIVLIGFSQGGAVALYTGCRFSQPLAAIFALSSWLPLAEKVQHANLSANNNTPIYMMHGTQDMTVEFKYGQQSAQILSSLGYQVKWQSYAMGHTVNPEQCINIGQYLYQLLK